MPTREELKFARKLEKETDSWSLLDTVIRRGLPEGPEFNMRIPVGFTQDAKNYADHLNNDGKVQARVETMPHINAEKRISYFAYLIVENR